MGRCLIVLALLLPAARIQGETGTAVFIARAKELASELEVNFRETMGADWEERIAVATGGSSIKRAWSPEEAGKFLDRLEWYAGKRATLARLKTASYIKKMKDEGEGYYAYFRRRANFYESYVGSEGVGQRLSTSFTGFYGNSIWDMEDNAQYIRMGLFEVEDPTEARRVTSELLETSGMPERQRTELLGEFFEFASPRQDGEGLVKYIKGTFRRGNTITRKPGTLSPPSDATLRESAYSRGSSVDPGSPLVKRLRPPRERRRG